MTRLVLSLAAVFGLLNLAGTTDVLSEVTRPLVVWLLGAVGITAADHGDALSVGRLIVPWTRDCAGLNVLAMLWAVVLWTNRAKPLSRRMWMQLLLAVPVAFVANVARILTLIALRTVLFPAVESPQLHYFLGFLWVMPTLGVWAPRRSGSVRARYLETLYLAAILALLAPHVGGPGGSLAALAALVALAQSRVVGDSSTVGVAAGAAWTLAGFVIAAAGMESLWVAWLLTCPWFASPSLVGSWSGRMLLAGTIPLVAMHPMLRVAAAAAIAWQGWHLSRAAAPLPGAPASGSPAQTLGRPALSVGLACAFLVPFVWPALSAAPAAYPPPAGTMTRKVEPTSYAVRLVGQSPDIEVAWFTPSGEGRHHTLPVCLRYRGVVVTPSAEEGVMSDGRRWMREFFVHDGVMLADYGSYLRRTFRPFSSPGVHIVMSAPVESMSAASFAHVTGTIARELDRLARTAS